MKYFYLLCLILMCAFNQSCKKCKTISENISNPSNPCSAAFTYTVNCNQVTFTDGSRVPNTPDLTWAFVDGIPASSTAQNPTITFPSCGTYLVCLMVSNNGSLSSCSDLICENVVIEDSSDPILAGVPADMTVACEEVPEAAVPTASDNCDTDVIIAFNETTTDGDCPKNYTLTRTWTATDKCGNVANRVQVITVEDSTNPEIISGAIDLIVDCDGNGNTAALNNWLADNGGAMASDNCSDITWSNDFSSLTDDCGNTGSATVSFTVTDACGNLSATTATFTIQDTTVLVINNPASDVTVQCDGSGNIAALNNWLASNGGAAASDVCSNVSWANDFIALNSNCGDTGSATVTFTATDACGNPASTIATFTIQDLSPPNITTTASNMTVQCDGAGNTADLNAWLASNGNAAAMDNCSNVSWTNDFSTLTDSCGATGSATVIFTASDACGNSANTTATFAIQQDTASISIATAASNITVQCNGSGNTTALNTWLSSHGGAVVSNDCSGISWSNDFTGLSDQCGATGSATVTFTATDACGNPVSTSATFTIQDTSPPTITTTASNMTVQCDGAGNSTALNNWLASKGGAAATDNCSTVNWSNNFTALSDLCGATGSATVTFTATDACGNAVSTTATFTIADNVPPTAICRGNVELILDENCSIAITAETLNEGSFDNCELAFLDVSPSFFDHCGTYMVTLQATDICGNTSTCTATVEVIDNIPPTIFCPADITVNGTYNMSGQCTAFVMLDSPASVDNCPPVTLTNDAPPGNIFPMGATMVTWTAEDDCMNTTTCSFMVTVVCDTCCIDEMAFFTNAANVQTNGALGSCFINFNATGLNDCMQISYNWGDGQQSGPFPENVSVNHVYAGPGTYTVCSTIEEVNALGNVCWVYEQCEDIMIFCDDCCIDYDIFSTAVENAISISTNNNSCTATFSIDYMPYCDFVEFVDWGDGQIDSGPFSSGTILTHQYLSSGNYSVCRSAYEEFDGVTCFNNYLCDMIVLNCPAFVTPPDLGLHSGNGNTHNAQKALEQVGQQHGFLKKPTMNLFPNPTTDIVNLRFENMIDSKSGSIQIADRSGRIVKIETIEPGIQELSISFSGLPTGVYLIKVIREGTPLFVDKIIKQ